MSPAQLTLALLESLGEVNGSTGWKCTFGTAPDTIDKLVTVFDTDPQLDGRSMRTPEYEVYEHPGLMIHVRAKEYATAFDKMDAVVAALERIARRTEGGIGGGKVFVGYFRKYGPAFMGRTETNLRYSFSVNYTTTIEDL